MMDIEVDHCDPFSTMGLSCMFGAGRDVVEQAESHRLPRFGVMTGRAYGAERIVCVSGNDSINCSTQRANTSYSGFSREGRHTGVAINHNPTFTGNRFENLFDEIARVNPGNLFDICLWRIVANETVKLRCGQRFRDGF
jgi:hypothetical protein